MLIAITVILSTFLLSYFAVLAVRRIAIRYNWVANPRADRWHENVTALHGGVGMALAFIVGSVAWITIYFGEGIANFGSEWLLSLVFQHKEFWIILGGATLCFLLGLVDDFIQLKPGVKLLMELLIISFVVLLGLTFVVSPYQLFNIIITYLWFVGIMNAVNLLDNMDGVSSGVVIISVLGLVVIALVGQQGPNYFAAVWGAILVASALGFWMLNKPPAKIFMGDSGSLFLGFTLAAFSLPSNLNGFYAGAGIELLSTYMQILIAITLASIPILDTTLVTITRLMRGQSPSVGGRDHSTHRLAQSGLSNWQTLGFLYSVSALCVVVAIFMDIYPSIGVFIFGIALVALLMVAIYLARVQMQVSPIRQEGWQQLVTSITYRVPLIKMILDVFLISLSLYGGYLIRFDFRVSPEILNALINSFPVVIVCCLSANFIFRVYEFSWRLASFRDILNYGLAAMVGMAASLAIITLVFRFEDGFSRGAYVIFAMIYFIGMISSRFSFRFIDDLLLKFRKTHSPTGKIPILIYGYGREAIVLAEEIFQNYERWGNYSAVGIVNTSKSKISSKLLGIPFRDPEYWQDYDFGGTPEIILADDNIENAEVEAFATAFKGKPRIRRFTSTLIDIQS